MQQWEVLGVHMSLNPSPFPTHTILSNHSPATEAGGQDLGLEFAEMSEMLPETWLPEQHEAGSTPHRPSQSIPVTNILVWTV